MNPREERGLALANSAKISRNGKGWIVPSQTGGTTYTVALNGCSHPSLRSKSDVGQRSTLHSALPQHLCPLLRDAQAGAGAGTVLLTLVRPTAAQISHGKEVVGVAKSRKYHRVKAYPRKGGGRVKPHVRRMPKKCK
jgi:hypothetical protein